MSTEDRDDKDPLQSLIAVILDTENRGELVDRDSLLAEHPEHADSLREFFATHDQIKSAADVDPPTLPPQSSGPPSEDPTIAAGTSPLDDPTLPPSKPGGGDPTLPPTESASKTNGPTVGDQIRYFGDYELLEEIARGGMGVVYKARQVNLNRIVALKMILAGQFAGQEDVQRFYTEAEAAAALDHPGIVPIFEIGEHAGQHYFSMGYIEGESLARKVADGPLPPREAAELARKICDAMAYAHERGVIHRDLKPANILIDSNGQPKVTDFGLAKKTESDSGLTGTGQILGTPAYMPPEQASGKNDVGPLADVYSLGAILYCLLTGRPPFQAASPMDTLLQVLDQEPVSPRRLNSKTPQDLESVTLKCLQKVASKRYSGCHELGLELHRFLSGEPTEARPVGSIRYAWSWYWAHLGKVAGGLTLACCAFYATNYCTVAIMKFWLYSGNTFWVTTYLIPSLLIILPTLIAGLKFGILTLSGHRLSLVGSTLILCFVAYDHIRLGFGQPLLTVGQDTFSGIVSRPDLGISNYTLMSFIPTLFLWYLICVVTQLLAMFTTDRTGNVLTWSEDVATLRQCVPTISRGLAVSAVGGVIIWLNLMQAYPKPAVAVAGQVFVASGVLMMLRFR